LVYSVSNHVVSILDKFAVGKWIQNQVGPPGWLAI